MVASLILSRSCLFSADPIQGTIEYEVCQYHFCRDAVMLTYVLKSSELANTIGTSREGSDARGMCLFDFLSFLVFCLFSFTSNSLIFYLVLIVGANLDNLVTSMATAVQGNADMVRSCSCSVHVCFF